MSERDPRFAWDDYTDLRGAPSGSEPSWLDRISETLGWTTRPSLSGCQCGCGGGEPPADAGNDRSADPAGLDAGSNPFEVGRRLANAVLDGGDGWEIDQRVQAKSRARTRLRLADDDPGDTSPALDGPDDLNELTAPAIRAEAREIETRLLAADRPENVAARRRDRYTKARDDERKRQAAETRNKLAELGIAGVGHEPDWL